ncbi:galactose oxidase-like domain-containing protein [Streptomyces sp. NPDC050844]|uniref:galactose oxidase-like domain-containing protein n=1 Tax=Streptomyces sp. NPDC050844 TaxID=3155790 RepID=UPI0033E05393
MAKSSRLPEDNSPDGVPHVSPVTRRTLLAGALSATASGLLLGGASRASAVGATASLEPLDITGPEALLGRRWIHLKLDENGRGLPVRLPLRVPGLRSASASAEPTEIRVTSTTGLTRIGAAPDKPENDGATLRVAAGSASDLWVTPRRLGSPGVPADRLEIRTRRATAVVDVWIEPAGGRWFGADRDHQLLDLEIVAVHAALVRKGDGAEVVMWSPARDRDDDGNLKPDPDRPDKWSWTTFHMGALEARALDLATLKTRDRPMTGGAGVKPRNVFCGGHAHLPDGKLLVAGGHVDPAHLDLDDAVGVHVYDPNAANAWSRPAVMGVRRWYPAVTTMPDGRMLIAGGSRTAPAHEAAKNDLPKGYWNQINNDYQIYNPADGSLTPRSEARRLIDPELLASPKDKLAAYPNVFVLPGKTATSLPLVALVETNRAWLYQYDKAKGDAPLVLAPAVYTMRGKGSRSYPTYGSNVLLPLKPGAGKHRILVVGGQHEGQTKHRDITYEQKSTATAEILDVDAFQPLSRQKGWRRIERGMKHPRVLCDSTLMADGTVLVSGGTEKGWGDMNRVPVLASEIFDPVSETFRLADSALTDRRYHSVALLQPDGTVLKAGSTGGFAHDPDTNESLFDEHTTAERYYPPYLYRGPRPAITAVAGANDAWTTLGYDTEVALQARGVGLDAQSKVALIRFGSTTHGNNMDQRYVWLRTTAQDSDAYERWTIQFRTPETSAVAPAGDYMLVVVDSTGVPSSSRFVHLSQGSTD